MLGAEGQQAGRPETCMLGSSSVVPRLLFCRSPVCGKGITGHGVQRAPACEAFVSDTNTLVYSGVHEYSVFSWSSGAEEYLGFQIAPTLPNIPLVQGHCKRCVHDVLS